MTIVLRKFEKALKYESDIKGHIQFIYGESGGIILECGVRDGFSTSALLLGVEAQGGILFSVDRERSCGTHFDGHPAWKFIHSESTNFEKIAGTILGSGHLLEFDLLFLDTIHTYEQVAQELKMWGPKVKEEGKILVHDVEKFKGADSACREFARLNKWEYKIRPGYNGLGILRRKK